MRALLHRLAHVFFWNYGEVVSAWSGDTLWIAFRCATCGRCTGAHRSRHRRRCADPAGAMLASFEPPTSWEGDR